MVTVKFLSKEEGRMVLCTGAIMSELSIRLAGAGCVNVHLKRMLVTLQS